MKKILTDEILERVHDSVLGEIEITNKAPFKISDEEILSKLDPDMRSLFIKYSDMRTAKTSAARDEGFALGFRAGIKSFIEIIMG